VNGEQSPREARREPVKAAPDGPLRRGERTCSGARRKEAVHAERQRVLELAGDAQPGARHERARAGAVEALQVPDLGGVLALG
jgi:hypothetical protein